MEYTGLLPLPWVERFASPIATLLETAVAHGCGECEVADILAQVKAGQMHLLVDIQHNKVISVLALEPCCYPQQTVLNIAYGAGRNVRRLLSQVMEVARAIDAVAIETRTRPEVARLYRRAGFTTPYIVSRLEL